MARIRRSGKIRIGLVRRSSRQPDDSCLPMACRWAWPPSSSGTGINSRAAAPETEDQPRGADRTKRELPAGGKTYASRWRCRVRLNAAFTSAIVKASSMSCSVSPRTSCNLHRPAGGDENHAMVEEMRALGSLHHVELADTAGRVETATVEIRYGSIHSLPPIGKQKRHPALSLTSSAPGRGKICRIARGSIGSSSPICLSLRRRNRREAPLVRAPMEERDDLQILSSEQAPLRTAGTPGQVDCCPVF